MEYPVEKQTPEAPEKIDHTHRAYQGIRQMLFQNQIVPGQKIAYSDLAKRLHMSATPVIQALKFLEFQGLVRHEPNRGYHAAPIDITEVEESYDLRILIETSLLDATLKRLDPAGIARLQKALNAHAQSAGGQPLNQRLHRDMEFHLVLAALSGCGVQQKVLRDLFDILYLKYRTSYLFITSMDTAAEEHRRLLSAITAGDLHGARKVLSEHILHVKRHVVDGLKQMLAQKTTLLADWE
jgi:DNA-binding GntR family transcriptional regulator